MEKSTDAEEDSSCGQTQNSTVDSEGASFLESNNVSVENSKVGVVGQGTCEAANAISQRQVTRALVKSKESPECFRNDNGASPKCSGSFPSDTSPSSTKHSYDARESQSGGCSSPPHSIMSQETGNDMEVDETVEAVAVVELEQNARRKEKEPGRLEEEEKRVLNEMLDYATNYHWGKVKVLVESWIKNNINLGNFRQLNQEFYIEIRDCPTIAKVSMQWRAQFVNKLNDRVSNLLSKAVSGIITGSELFITRMTAYFVNYVYLPEDSLRNVLETEYNIVSGQLGDEFVRGMFYHAYVRFYRIFMHHNHLILSSERDLFGIVNYNVIMFYNREMERYVAEGPYSPQVITGIHGRLVVQLQERYADMLKFSKVNNDVLRAKEYLKSALDQAFLPYFTGNEMKLKELYLKTNSVISSCKDEYTRDMEGFLSDNPDGVADSKLDNEHDRVVTKVGNMLDAKLKLEVRGNEPVEEHGEVLKEYCQKYFLVVTEANRKSVEVAMDRKKSGLGNELESPKTQNKDENMNHDGTLSSTVASSNVNDRTTASNKQDRLHPLVVELRNCSHFVMAIRVDGEDRRLDNEFGESETSATVGFSHDENKFVYGSQVVAKNLTTTTSHSFKRWDLGELLISGKYEWNDLVTVGGTDYVVSFEFVLGFILRKLKKAGEKQVENKLCGVVMVIPFWLSSTQRVQMRDGARLAGFSQVYLVNEASAAAFACVSNNLWGGPNEALVVISANRNRVDTFVYQSGGGRESTRINMLVHHNSFNVAKNQQNLLMNFLSMVGWVDEWDCVKKKVRDSIHNSIKQAKYRCKFQNTKVLTISGSTSEGVEMLDKLATEFGKKIELCDSVLCGALVLSADPEKIRGTITDLISSKLFIQKDGGYTHWASKRDSIPCEFLVCGKLGDTHFYQINEMGTRIRVGTLSVMNLKPHHTAKFMLQVSNEEIVSCRDEMSGPSKSYSRAVTRGNDQVVQMEWKWKTPTLSEERFVQLASWLDHLIPSMSPEETEIAGMKKALLGKCVEMIGKIDSNEIRIKSNLIRGVVKDKIAEAQRFAEHQNTRMDDLRKQAEVVDQLWEKYSKK